MDKIVELSDREHILARPSMYIGGVDKVKSTEWLYTDGKMEQQEVEYVPGLLKIINEIIDNCVDVAIKTNFAFANEISVKITDKSVTISDNGTGISNELSDTGKPMPVLAWGHARAGSNFTDSRKQIGMNGIGSFATNCFSSVFTATSDDGKTCSTYKWSNNAADYHGVTSADSQNRGVTVQFTPDLQRFGMDTIDDIHIELIHQRLINLKISFPEIVFKFNGRKININSFKKYVALFNEHTCIISGDGYDIAILPNAQDDFQQFSYVNGLKISDGGSHVDYIIGNVVSRIRDKLVKKYKAIKPGDIRNKLLAIVFFRGFPDAKFSSQSKEKITNAQGEISKFLGNIDFDDFAKAVLKNKDIIDPITEIYRLKEEYKRRQELKTLNKPKKIRDEKYLPAIGDPKYLLIVEGECLSADTRVMLPDFSTKEIRNVKIGDYILGDDMAPTYVTAKSTQLRKCVTLKTECGEICAPKTHKLKCYDSKEQEFKVMQIGDIVKDIARYKLLKSKINTSTRGMRVDFIGKNRKDGFYLSTDTSEFIRFTENDVFTIVRGGYMMPCSGPDLQRGDVLLLTKEDAND